MLAKRSGIRGDTLIEVLFAVTVFSFVAVGALAIMNQGSATAQHSLETTLVRAEIDAQAETLRFIHDSYIAAYPSAVAGTAAEWPKIVAQSVSQASDFGTCTPPQKSFVVNTKTATVANSSVLTNTVPTYSQVRYAPTIPATIPATTTTVIQGAEGIWVEAVRSPIVSGATSGFIDFHIRACWDAAGQSTPATLGTIVRLYEPR